MRKLLAVAGIVALLSASCGGAGKPVYTPQQIQQIKREYYQKGYNDGYRKAFKIGYRTTAFLIAENLKSWETDIKALEVGKEAVKNGIIPSPVIYRQVTNGVPEIVIEGEDISPDSLEKLSSLDVPTPYKPKEPKTEVVPPPDKQLLNTLSPIQKFSYLQGYRNGAEKGAKDGILMAKKDAIGSLKDVESYIYRLETDKYLNTTYLVSAPRIYRELRGNKVVFLVVPSRVEKVRTVKDIINGNGIPSPESRVELSPQAGGIHLPASSTPVSLPKETPTKLYRVRIDCSKLSEVEKLGIDYEISGDTCRAVFYDRAQEQEFCKKYGFCLGIQDP